MKGQSQVFEQVLLFGIAVAIFVTCFGIFQVYQSYFSDIAANDHTMAVGDLIYDHILELSRIEGMDASTVVDIPARIKDDRYRVLINQSYITVITDNGAKSLTSLGLLSGKLTFTPGETGSSKGEIIIYKRGANIIIE